MTLHFKIWELLAWFNLLIRFTLLILLLLGKSGPCQVEVRSVLVSIYRLNGNGGNTLASMIDLRLTRIELITLSTVVRH